nr:MAG TPA: hypothetical protein [Caudoviricetes sp.]
MSCLISTTSALLSLLFKYSFKYVFISPNLPCM